jgi:nucleoside 2-deoxyribosyltransferase
VDRKEFSGDIVEEIKRLIRGSAAVIVDLSEVKPNVLYEAGYAHALRKPVVHICSTPLSKLPFDVRNWNTIAYRRGQTALLREPLARRLKAVMGE